MAILRGTGLPSQFGHKAAQDLAAFGGSFNNASQVVAWASADGATTGTKIAFFGDGTSVVLPADAAFDWSADPQLGVWATAQSYDAYDMRYVLDANGKKHYFMCIASHTSAADNKPVSGRNWESYWKLSNQTAEPAVGTVLADGQSVYVLVMATKDGELTVVKAGDVALDAAVALKIPRFEPEMFVPLAIMLIDAGGAVTLGTTDISAIVTITQLTHPVFPHPDNL